jgi:hypothetical protein
MLKMDAFSSLAMMGTMGKAATVLRYPGALQTVPTDWARPIEPFACGGGGSERARVVAVMLVARWKILYRSHVDPCRSL